MDDYEERIKAYRERDYENDDINGDFGDADDFEDESDDVRDGDGDFGDYVDQEDRFDDEFEDGYDDEFEPRNDDEFLDRSDDSEDRYDDEFGERYDDDFGDRNAQKSDTKETYTHGDDNRPPLPQECNDLTTGGFPCLFKSYRVLLMTCSTVPLVTWLFIWLFQSCNPETDVTNNCSLIWGLLLGHIYAIFCALFSIKVP